MFALVAVALASPVGLSSSAGDLVLTHTDVSAEVVADVAVVDVVQTFENPFDIAVDATYVFPLPEDAAVRDMSVSCGDRTIRSELVSAEEARERYEAARADGRRAALTSLQRANVFTQDVAGLCPGETVHVWLQYVVTVDVDAGVHTFVFPTTVEERYGAGPDLEMPPLTMPDGVTRRVSLRLQVHAGGPLGGIWSDAHDLSILAEDGLGAEVALLDDAVPDGDIAIAWTEVVDRTKAVVVGTEDAYGDRYVSLSLVPPAMAPAEEGPPRELVFVLDSSCSMAGEEWGAAKAVVEEALANLRPGEAFNLVRFSDAADRAFDRPLPASPGTVAKARAWMDHFDGGGSEMLQGMREALSMPGDPDALRLVLMVTDGHVDGGRQMYRDLAAHFTTREGRNDRVFSLGIGAATNDELLDGLALHGRGLSSVLRPGMAVDEEVGRFYRRIDQPVLTDIEVDWGGLGATGAGITHPRDVFAGQPLHLVARLEGEPFGEVVVRGRAAGQPVTLRVPVDVREVGEVDAVEALWARRQLAALEADPWLAAFERDEEVLALALAHGLVSRKTSLVAVDDGPGGCVADTSLDVPTGSPRGSTWVPGGVAHGLGGLGTKGLGSRGSAFGGGGGSASGLLRGLGGSPSAKKGYGVGGGAFGTRSVAGQMRPGTPEWPEELADESRTALHRMMALKHHQIRYCYQRELVKRPLLGGKVRVRFVIGSDGVVTDAEVVENTMSTEGGASVGSCIVGRFRRMRLDASVLSEDATVTWSGQFEPQN